MLNVSLDGYIADEDGKTDWTAPDEEFFSFINDLERPVGTYRAYVQRRTSQGLSKLDTMRCLKRYIAREIYHQLTSPPPINPPACLK
jgi:hypothetical protein